MPEYKIDRILIAQPTLAAFLAEIEEKFVEGYSVDFIDDFPSQTHLLFTCSMVKTDSCMTRAESLIVARQKRNELMEQRKQQSQK